MPNEWTDLVGAGQIGKALAGSGQVMAYTLATDIPDILADFLVARACLPSTR